MSAPQSLLQAALNRLAARLGSGLADTAATLSLIAQDAPARMQQEFSLFWEEVEQEAARLERAGASDVEAPPGTSPADTDPQEMIDALRAQVARLASRFEAHGSGGSGTPVQGSGSQGSGPA